MAKLPMGHQPPAHKFRAGAIIASVWQNPCNDGQGNLSFQSVTLERRYKNKEGAWKSTGSLRVADLPKASLVLSKAYEYLVFSDHNIEKEAETARGE